MQKLIMLALCLAATGCKMPDIPTKFEVQQAHPPTSECREASEMVCKTSARARKDANKIVGYEMKQEECIAYHYYICAKKHSGL